MARNIYGGNKPDKYRIGSGISSLVFSVTGRKLLVQGANTEMKMNSSIAGDSTTGREKFTARQWEALIGFCGVETKKQV